MHGTFQEDEKDIATKSTEHVDKLLEAIQQFGITFRVCYNIFTLRRTLVHIMRFMAN